MADKAETGSWRVDKHIPVAVIFAIIVQSVAFVWWVGNIVHRLDVAVEANNRQDTRLDNVESMINSQAVNSATLTAELSAVRESLNDLKAGQAEMNRVLRELVQSGAGQ